MAADAVYLGLLPLHGATPGGGYPGIKVYKNHAFIVTAGLRIIDIQDPQNPREVGYLDTAPNLSGPGSTVETLGS